MDETQKSEKRKQARERVERLFPSPVGSDTRCGKKRLVYVPPTAPSKFFRIIKWVVGIGGVVTVVVSNIFGGSAVISVVGILVLIVWLSFLRKP